LSVWAVGYKVEECLGFMLWVLVGCCAVMQKRRRVRGAGERVIRQTTRNVCVCVCVCVSSPTPEPESPSPVV
jgi:hypothetical protein